VNFKKIVMKITCINRWKRETFKNPKYNWTSIMEYWSNSSTKLQWCKEKGYKGFSDYKKWSYFWWQYLYSYGKWWETTSAWGGYEITSITCNN